MGFRPWTSNLDQAHLSHLSSPFSNLLEKPIFQDKIWVLERWVDQRNPSLKDGLPTPAESSFDVSSRARLKSGQVLHRRFPAHEPHFSAESLANWRHSSSVVRAAELPKKRDARRVALGQRTFLRFRYKSRAAHFSGKLRATAGRRESAARARFAAFSSGM